MVFLSPPIPSIDMTILHTPLGGAIISSIIILTFLALVSIIISKLASIPSIEEE